MDKATIGTNAGIVWRTINESGRPWKYEELKSATNLSDRDLNAAIGWLARENKIEFDTESVSYTHLTLPTILLV